MCSIVSKSTAEHEDAGRNKAPFDLDLRLERRWRSQPCGPAFESLNATASISNAAMCPQKSMPPAIVRILKHAYARPSATGMNMQSDLIQRLRTALPQVRS